MTYNSVAGLVGYVNASVDKTVAANGIIAANTANFLIGDNQRFAGTFWNGKIDEARLASVARSADWITTEYNNQFAPGTFETLGAEVNFNPMAAIYTFTPPIFKSPLTADHLQVPSDQTDFPILIDKTDNRFKTVANGGHVKNVNGFDIRPYSDSGLTTPLTYELDYYNASTGQVVMWVKRSTLSSSSDTVTYLKYGDASITTDGSSSATWSNSFISLYHLKDGSALSVLDSMGANNGTNHGATATAGQIDGAANFVSASTQYIDLSTGVIPGAGLTAFTFSAWVNGTTFPNAYNSVIVWGDATHNAFIFVKSNGKLACGYITSGPAQVIYDGTGSHTLSASTWYYLTLVGSNASGLIGYLNGASDGTAASASGILGATVSMRIGSDSVNASREWNGVIDEPRISSVARSADWITVEYNNQKVSSTFITLGSESSA